MNPEVGTAARRPTPGLVAVKDTGSEVTGDGFPESESTGRALALRVHTQLRGMILSGEMPPGTVLLQAKLARTLGVSRTPLREAFRLLQEEGLIDAAPDKRAKVRAVDPGDLDSTYGTRIMLEALGVSVTIRTVTDHEIERIWAALATMRTLAKSDLAEQWYPAHREFHRLTTAAVAPQLARQISSLREHCDRYIRFDRVGHADAVARADAEHEALAAAFAARDEQWAVRTIARHLARTSLGIMTDVAPDREPVATRAALKLVES